MFRDIGDGVGKRGESRFGIAGGHKNNFGQRAVLITLHQDKIRISGQGGQNRFAGWVLAGTMRHLKKPGGCQGNGAGAGLPETPGIFAGLIDFQHLMTMLDGGDPKAAFGGQAEEFAD